MRTNVRFRSFDDGALDDFGDLAFVVGIRTDWLENVEFEMSAGYGLLGYYKGDRNHSFVGDLNLRYFVRDGTVLRLSFQNQNAYDLIGNAFAETAVRFGIEHHFGERTAAELALFSTRLDNKTWNSGVNYYAGIDQGVRAIHAAAGGDYGPIQRTRGGRSRSGSALGLFPLILFFLILGGLGRGGRHGGGRGGGWFWPLFMLSSMGGRGHYGGGGGFGGGGGGFGGGGFGGGGGFSGGGASGGW